eukprot:TRINITY_DN10391_c0_g2_i1.p1 TRINITY_DN10391_c0_g2~~TRINITY_DN10391_c0_g2_i1.p1  ORF type:complete len:448 (-),score=69.09 TRINITY_DN10391_c0_g2_i1:275-1618(-)
MPAVVAAENMRTITEPAAASHSAKICLQQNMDFENMVPSTSLGDLSGVDILRQSSANHRCRQNSFSNILGSSMASLAASQTQQQTQAVRAPATGSSANNRRGGLSDITNLNRNGCQNVKGKVSTGQRVKRPSDSLQAGATVHDTGHALARLQARPVAPPVPQTWMALESVSPVEISSPEHEQDATDLRNPQECKEYESEIIAGLFAEETLYMPRSDYMVSQADINGKMRAILLDWLVEVHMKYKLRRATLYLAVNLIDRYLAVQPIARNRLQLVGVVCMFVAAKVEQINPPRVADFVYITDNTYTKEDVLSMECAMLSSLGFNIAVPTQAHFLDCLLKANQCLVKEYRALVDYLLELALVDVRMIKHEPSKVVSAALLLSNEILGRPIWPETMVLISRYSSTALRGCAEELRALLRAAPSGTLQAVRRKYLLQQHCSIARVPEVLRA